jgi:CubicO group peptidase (beta-lactamase class C family)
VLSFRLGWGIVLARPLSYPIQRRIQELDLAGFGPPLPPSSLSADEWLERMGTLPLLAQPGERWMYNTGSYLLGVLLSRAARRPLPELLQERLFEPLGMKDTAFQVTATARERLVDLYIPSSDGLALYDAAATSAWRHAPVLPDAAAGLISTADDFFAFSRFMLEGGVASGGRRLLSRDSIQAMTTNRLTAAQRSAGAPILDAGRGWGLGMSVVLEQEPEGLPVGAFGWDGGFGTSWAADPRSGRTALLLTGTAFSSPEAPSVHRAFRRAVLS